MTQIVCLDFEGVLVPDIWPHVAERTGIPELKITTRDFKNYRELMEKRVEICRAGGVTLNLIQTYIRELNPYPGALEFVRWIRERHQFVILSDTFYEFVPHFMEQFGYPSLFCHTISFNEKLGQLDFQLRIEDPKKRAVQTLKELNFQVYAAGDSYNDVTMLLEAHHANLFQAPATVASEFPQLKNLQNYEEMREAIDRAAHSKT